MCHQLQCVVLRCAVWGCEGALGQCLCCISCLCVHHVCEVLLEVVVVSRQGSVLGLVALQYWFWLG